MLQDLEKLLEKVLNTKEEDLVDQVRSREMKLSVAARQRWWKIRRTCQGR